METPKENLIHEATKPIERTREGFEMSTEQAVQITAELSKLNDSIVHDKPILIDDIEDLSKVARGTKIDVGGEIMTVEEAEKIPDLKMNAEIWKEMKEGNFDNTRKLTRITPTASRYLENLANIILDKLISAEGLVLPETVRGVLSLESLTSARGLRLPRSTEGVVFLNSLTSTEDLVLPQTISKYIYLNGLPPAQKDELRKKYPQHANNIN